MSLSRPSRILTLSPLSSFSPRLSPGPHLPLSLPLPWHWHPLPTPCQLSLHPGIASCLHGKIRVRSQEASSRMGRIRSWFHTGLQSRF